MLKIALLGSGKTGAEVLKLAPSVTVFNSRNLPSFEALSSHDVIISFLPGEAFLSYIPLLLETGKPVVTGSTGFSWPHNFHEDLVAKKIKWIHAHNFSLGMNIVKKMIETMGLLGKLFEDYSFHIHEIHHTKKLDAPSGTALSFKNWLAQNATISSERTGDVIGFHELTFDSSDEKISLVHEAKDRSIFARGALWASDLIVKDDSIPYGLNHFNHIVNKHLNL
jgi:4-hydroxy-tetrahydrodipicolinate reductase